MNAGDGEIVSKEVGEEEGEGAQEDSWTGGATTFVDVEIDPPGTGPRAPCWG